MCEALLEFLGGWLAVRVAFLFFVSAKAVPKQRVDDEVVSVHLACVWWLP